MPRAESTTSPAKRQPLTLVQLAAYDDILTDALVDHVFYWTKIPKNRSSYHPARGTQEGEIAKILQDEIVLNKDLDAAEKKLLATDSLRRFANGLKTAKEKDDFGRHLRRYMQIYLPDCPWEVNSTNRYTIVTHEASITARRYIQRNESIKYLSGIQVKLTPEEERDIASRKKDFSIVVSSRNKCTSLFMGPARFANHDCDANAKLMTTSHLGIEIIATKPIELGDEITVTYGENYFGVDNCECLCKSCEDGLRNGWQQAAAAAADKKGVEEKEANYLLRKRRREDSLGDSSRTSSVTPLRPRVRKTKPKIPKPPDLGMPSAVDPLAPEAESPRGRKRHLDDTLTTPPNTPAKRPRHVLQPRLSNLALSRGSSATSSVSSSGVEVLETDVTSPDRESLERVLPTPETEMDRILGLEESEQSQFGKLASGTAPEEGRRKAQPRRTTDAQSKRIRPTVDLSAMSIQSILNGPVDEDPQHVVPIAISIETAETIVPLTGSAPGTRTLRKYQRRVFMKQTTPPPRQRKCGDYVLTPLLLSEPAMAWIQCSICSTYFVQQNAYVTRSACPRCERHSKLYGYMWPKTDRAGASDKDERVLDHRLVHRFLNLDGERKARGRKSASNWKPPAEEGEEEEEPDAEVRTPRGRPKKMTPRKITKAEKAAAEKAYQQIVEDEMVDEEEADTSGLRRSGRSRRVSSRLVST